MSKGNVKTVKPHISLNIRNIGESVEFYQKLFGIEPMKFIGGNKNEEGQASRFGYAKFDVEHPPLNLALNEVPYQKGGSLSHLGIQVESSEDVLATRERWIAEGLMTADEMKVDCCFALQDKTWARDPDGNEWEVFVVLENTEGKAADCACGDRVEANELSTSACCTPSQKASTIGATSAPCC